MLYVGNTNCSCWIDQICSWITYWLINFYHISSILTWYISFWNSHLSSFPGQITTGCFFKMFDLIHFILVEHLWERKAGKHVFRFTCTLGLISPLCTFLQDWLRQICLDGKTGLQHFISFHSTFPFSFNTYSQAFSFFCSCPLVVPEKKSNSDAWDEKNFVTILCLLSLVFLPSVFLSAQENLFPPSVKSAMPQHHESAFHVFSPSSFRVIEHRMTVYFRDFTSLIVFPSAVPVNSISFPFPQ